MVKRKHLNTVQLEQGISQSLYNRYLSFTLSEINISSEILSNLVINLWDASAKSIQKHHVTGIYLVVRHIEANVKLYANLHHTIFYSLVEDSVSVDLISYCSGKTWVSLSYLSDMDTCLVREISDE